MRTAVLVFAAASLLAAGCYSIPPKTGLKIAPGTDGWDNVTRREFSSSKSQVFTAAVTYFQNDDYTITTSDGSGGLLMSFKSYDLGTMEYSLHVSEEGESSKANLLISDIEGAKSEKKKHQHSGEYLAVWEGIEAELSR